MPLRSIGCVKAFLEPIEQRRIYFEKYDGVLLTIYRKEMDGHGYRYIVPAIYLKSFPPSS